MQGSRPIRASVMAGNAPLLLLGAVALAGLAASFVLAAERVPAGLAVLAAGGLLVAGEYRSEGAGRRLRLAASTAERLADAVILGALAWELFPASARAGTAAIVALSISFVADYMLVKGHGLGFRVLASGLALPLRYLAVAVGLLTANVEAGLWAAAAVGAVSLARRAGAVSREGEPA